MYHFAKTEEIEEVKKRDQSYMMTLIKNQEEQIQPISPVVLPEITPTYFKE